MTYLFSILLCFIPVVWGASTNTTSPSCPQTDEPTRSIWSILGNCGATLLVCVWHALHPSVPETEEAWYISWGKRLYSILLTFTAPEIVVGKASQEWWEARRKVKEFRQKGYEWSMTHSYFAEMGGFVYHDDEGRLSTLDSSKFLELCEKDEIANPDISAKEIKDKSKSDALGKLVLAVQLSWFVIQVGARGVKSFAITLVELDTVSMAALTLSYLFLWRDKPLRVECAHVFYPPQQIKEGSQVDWSTVWKPEPWYPFRLMARLICRRNTQVRPDEENKPLVGTVGKCVRSLGKRTILDSDSVKRFSLCLTWFVLGALHLTAWNFHFPTEVERTIWHVASLVLSGTPLAVISVWFLSSMFRSMAWSKEDGRSRIVVDIFQRCALVIGIASRVLLVGLMLASLRALPCSAYWTITWTSYIPHL